MQKKPITVKNLQANSIVENVHLNMVDMLRTEQPFVQDERDAWIYEVNILLQSIAFALLVTFGPTTKHSPNQMIFNEDMITRIKSKVDWFTITKARPFFVVFAFKTERETYEEWNYKFS